MPRPTITIEDAKSQLSATVAKFSKKEWAGTHAAVDRACKALTSGDLAAADLFLRRLVDFVRPWEGTDGVTRLAGELADACRERILRQYGGGMARSTKDLFILRPGETLPDLEDGAPWTTSSPGKA